MNKWAQVPVTTTIIYAVEIEEDENIQDAMNHVFSDVDGDISEIDETECFIADTDIEKRRIKMESHRTLRI